MVTEGLSHICGARGCLSRRPSHALGVDLMAVMDCSVYGDVLCLGVSCPYQFGRSPRSRRPLRCSPPSDWEERRNEASFVFVSWLSACRRPTKKGD